MKRARIIAGNWKMYKGIQETKQFLHALKSSFPSTSCKVVVAPSFPALAAAKEAAHGSSIALAAQNIHDAKEGAFTGEVSAQMVKEAGASYVILGHSERRELFHETDSFIQRKVKAALATHLVPILCIGEKEHDRESGNWKEVLHKQLDGSLAGFTAAELATLVIAYEPVWAIGTGKTATPEIAQETHAAIRHYVAKKWGEALSQKLPILYGGSVKPANMGQLIAEQDIDGALVGGASLDVESFTNLIIQGSSL